MDPPANYVRQQKACCQDMRASEHLKRVSPKVAVQLSSQTLTAPTAWDCGKRPSKVLVVRLVYPCQNMCS